MIEDNVKRILAKLPAKVSLVAAAKTRTPEEIKEAILAGIAIIGENYVQEAEEAFAALGHVAKWHFIGHLQKNKVRTAVQIFDMIETVDSFKLGAEIDKQCKKAGKIMPILVEVNSGREPQKYGVFPEKAEALVRELSQLEHIKIHGLMTMGPRFGDPELARPYFANTKQLFDDLAEQRIDNIDMHILSMGMSNTYSIAIEEGATMVRIGSKIFGERDYNN